MVLPAARVLVLSLAVPSFAACTSQALDVQPSAPQASTPATDVRVVDEAGLEQLRKAGTHDFKGAMGEISASAGCPSGNVDEPCMEAVGQQLRDQALARGANLVVIVRSAVAQSFPPQYSATGALYVMTPRR